MFFKCRPLLYHILTSSICVFFPLQISITTKLSMTHTSDVTFMEICLDFESFCKCIKIYISKTINFVSSQTVILLEFLGLSVWCVEQYIEEGDESILETHRCDVIVWRNMLLKVVLFLLDIFSRKCCILISCSWWTCLLPDLLVYCTKVIFLNVFLYLC